MMSHSIARNRGTRPRVWGVPSEEVRCGINGRLEIPMDKPLTLEQVIEFLLEAPLFESLDSTELSQVVHIMQVQGFRDGQSVFREGDDGDAWYVVFRGRAVVTKESPFGPSKEIALLEGPMCFGEMAILDGSSRSATVRSEGETTVFRFPRTPFQRLLDEGNLGAYKLVLAMAQILSQRQRQITQQLADLLGEDVVGGAAVRGAIGEMLDTYTVSE